VAVVDCSREKWRDQWTSSVDLVLGYLEFQYGAQVMEGKRIYCEEFWNIEFELLGGSSSIT
jgi:hypothetical protein